MNMSSAELAAALRALSDPVRMRIVALCRHGECSVSELTRVVAQSQPRVSQHLKQLCAAALLERFRDGHFVYYRVPLEGRHAAARRLLMSLLPADEPAFLRDIERLRELRGAGTAAHDAADAGSRRLHRALVELSVAAPFGDLLDVGSGQGRILKLLASRTHRAVGVDIDPDARQFARAELLLAGVDNASLRKGSMYDLPFADGEFDTVILDDVLGDADEPLLAIREARRLLRPGGRLLLLVGVAGGDVEDAARQLATWCAAAGLRLSTVTS